MTVTVLVVTLSGYDVLSISREAEAMGVDSMDILGPDHVGQSTATQADGPEDVTSERLDNSDGVRRLVARVEPVGL